MYTVQLPTSSHKQSQNTRAMLKKIGKKRNRKKKKKTKKSNGVIKHADDDISNQGLNALKAHQKNKKISSTTTTIPIPIPTDFQDDMIATMFFQKHHTNNSKHHTNNSSETDTKVDHDNSVSSIDDDAEEEEEDSQEYNDNDPVLPSMSTTLTQEAAKTIQTLSEAWNQKKRLAKSELGIEIVYRSKGGHIAEWDEQDPEKVKEWKDIEVEPVEADFNDWDTYFEWLDSVGQDSRAQLNHKLLGDEHKHNDSNNTSTCSNNEYQQQEKVNQTDKESEQERLQLSMQQMQYALPAPASASSFSSHNSMENGLKPYVHVAHAGSVHITYEDSKQEHKVIEYRF